MPRFYTSNTFNFWSSSSEEHFVNNIWLVSKFNLSNKTPYYKIFALKMLTNHRHLFFCKKIEATVLFLCNFNQTLNNIFIKTLRSCFNMLSSFILQHSMHAISNVFFNSIASIPSICN